jgi:HK97 family phage prohead protease
LQIDHKSFPVEIVKVDKVAGIIDAVVSVIGNIDHGDDIIHPGAFIKTISERGLKVRVLDNHNSNSGKDVIGKPISIREIGLNELPENIKSKYPDAKGGLYTVTQFDLEDEDAKKIFNKLANGYLDEWSIGFAIPKGKSDFTNETIDGVKRTIRNIRELILYEYSPVIWGMNEATTTVGAKNDIPESEEKQQSLMQTFWNIVDAFESLYLDMENWTGYTVADVFDNNTMIACARNIEAEFMYYQLRWFQDSENTYSFSPQDEWVGGNFAFVAGVKELQFAANQEDFVLELDNTKQGRVLSQRNFDKLNDAHNLLMEVINSNMPEAEDKTTNIENMSDDTNTEDLAKPEIPLTKRRELLLADIEIIELENNNILN